MRILLANDDGYRAEGLRFLREALDGVGGYTCYGQVDAAATTAAEELLPIGLAEGCRLLVDVPRDRPVRRADVEVPAGRLCDELHAEQRLVTASARP